MAKESLQSLYNEVSKEYDLGSFNIFSEKMKNPQKRKVFYDALSNEYELPDYTVFEAKVTNQAPSIKPENVFIEPEYSFRAAPEPITKPKVIKTESSRPLPLFNDNPEFLLFQPGGKQQLKEFGYIIVEPNDIQSKEAQNKEIAEAQNKLFIDREVLKEKQKGLSNKEALDKIFREVGGTPPNFLDLATEQSISGTVFRIVGLNQSADMETYNRYHNPEIGENAFSKQQELMAGIVSMLMPVDAALFSFGGKAAQLKKISQIADKSAKLYSKKFNIPLGQARVLAKNVVERITGGAGGFAAFDAGRDITSQIENTGTIDPIQALEALMKGTITGGSVGALGLAGSTIGKPGEFIGEVFGLGTVSPLLEGQEITAEGYLDAAATIIGLKFLKQFTPSQADRIKESIANELKIQTETSGRPMHEIANNIGNRLKTQLELTLEGKTSDKTSTKSFKGEVQNIGEKSVEPLPSEIITKSSERVQLNEDIKRISNTMESLEKSGVEQRVLDDLQMQIDAKVERLNEVGIGKIEINKALEPKTTPGTEEVNLQVRRRARSEQERLDQSLKDKDILNRQFEPDPMLEVPLHPADLGRRTVQSIESKLKTVDLLDGQKKTLGLELQKKFSDLDKTLQSNEKQLSNESLTPRQREKLEISKQKIKELQRDTKEQAENSGIELQIFLGVPTPRLLKQLFGSSKKKPTKYSDSEINRLYNSAISRLDKKNPEEAIIFKSPSNEPITKEQSLLSKGLNWFTSDMVERTANVGTPSSKEAAQLARKAIDIQKKIHGQLSKELDAALKASSVGQEARELSRFIKVDVNGNSILMSRLHAAIEGLIPVEGKELLLVEKHRDLIEKRGRIFEENEIMQEGKDGIVRPFKVIGRNIAPRVMSGEFFRILEKGIGSVEFNTLVNEFAKASGNSPENTKKYFQELKDNIAGETPESPTRTTQAEHSRKWSQIPHAIKIKGELIPLIEYRPYEYARRLADTGESRIGVARVFGQELANTSIINTIKKQIDAEGGSTKEFHEMVRALSGAPVETSYMDAGFTGSKALRGVKGAYNLIKQSSLSASLIPNIPEVLGNVRRFAGAPSMLKSIFRLTKNPIAVNDAMETLGAITVDIGNFSVDPNRPITSRIRALNEMQRRAFLYKYINEFQEKLSAVVASDKVDRFRKGKGTGKDIILLEEMGFPKTDAKLMASGNAKQSLYDALVRRAPAHLTGGAQRTGEQSRLERSRIFNTVSAFETYAQMKIRSLSRVVRTNQKTINEAVNEKNYKKLVDATRSITSEILGSAVSGATAQFLLAYIYGGEDNLEIKWNEVKANPLEFIIQSWAYTTFAGLYGSILQSTAEGGLDDPLDVFYPYVVITETLDAIKGKGRYTYDEGIDRLLKYSERFFPANRVMKQATVALGFGNEQAQKDNNAIKAYYRWRIKNKYGGTYSSVPDDEIKQFRSNMKKAYTAFRQGQDPSVMNEFIVKAVQGSNKDLQSIASSISGRKLLTKAKIAPGKSEPIFNNRLEVLRNNIGEKAYSRLQRHDLMLDMLSDIFN